MSAGPRTPRRSRALAVTALAAAALGSPLACSSPGPDQPGTRPGTESTMLPAARRNPPTEAVRSDVAPLLRRFPGLGEPVSAAWQSGTLGDDRVPGPTTYWIDAVVSLDPGTAARLRQTPSLAPATAPAPTPALAGQVPDGVTWLTGRQLAVALAGDGWGCEAFLAAERDTLVLLGVGER